MDRTLPTLFLSHGSPMHAIEPGAVRGVWQSLARELPRPRALLMVSAHWETRLPMLTGQAKPETIHDFYGFPRPLYQVQYPAPGAPQVAERALGLLKAAGFTAAIDGCRGLDHGAWSPLVHMYPAADVPTLQLSVQTELGPRHHLQRVHRGLPRLLGDRRVREVAIARHRIAARGPDGLTQPARHRKADRGVLGAQAPHPVDPAALLDEHHTRTGELDEVAALEADVLGLQVTRRVIQIGRAHV